MKYLGVIFFVLSMVWTWKVIHGEASVSFETHAAIQAKMAEVIKQAVSTRKPQATDIEIQRIWTEYINQDLLRAHFSYSFKEAQSGEVSASQLAGVGLLERRPAALDQFEEQWLLKEVQIRDESIVFENGILVDATADGGENL